MKNSLSPVFVRRNPTARKQRGNGLIFALLGAALTAMSAYGAFLVYEDKSLTDSTKADIVNVQDLITNSQAMFGRNNDYAGATTTSLVQAGAIPPRLRIVGTTTAANSFSLPITAAPASGTGVNDLLSVSWPLPRAACTDFVTGIASFNRRIDVGGAPVKPLDGAINGAATAAACDATQTPVVTFYFGRFAAVSR